MKYIEKLLYGTFIIQKKYKQLNVFYKLKKLFNLRDLMINFLKNIIYYLLNEVIEPNYMILIKNLENSKSMEDIINSHNKFLEVCLKEGLILDNIKIKLNDILSLCYDFCKIISHFDVMLQSKVIERIENNKINRKKEYNNNLYIRKKIKEEETDEAFIEVFKEKEIGYKNSFDKLTNDYFGRLKNFMEEIQKNNDSSNSSYNNLLNKISSNQYFQNMFYQ